MGSVTELIELDADLPFLPPDDLAEDVGPLNCGSILLKKAPMLWLGLPLEHLRDDI